MDIKEAWGKFDRGDRLSLNELHAMRTKIEQGLAYLETRNSDESRIAARQARSDLQRIKNYIDTLHSNFYGMERG